MLIRLHASKLKPGMFVVDSGLSVAEHSTLYSKEGLIETAEEVHLLLAKGYDEAFVDPEQGTYFHEHPEAREEVAHLYRPLREVDLLGMDEPVHEPTPLYEEARWAQKFYVDAISMAKVFYEDFKRDGKVHVAKADTFITEVLASVGRNPDALLSLVKLRTYDDYTYSHSLNVAIVALSFGKRLGFDDDYLRVLGLAGLFHDVGKVKVPAAILNKPEALTPRELAIMRRHPEFGYEMLAPLETLPKEARLAALQHHEHFGGGGYPGASTHDGLSRIALLVALADVYDALTSERAYKRALSQHEALCIIYNLREQQFHPVLTDKFIKLFGVYPVGCLVQLTSGEKGVVVRQSTESLLHPVVRVLTDETGRVAQPVTLDLSQPEFRDTQEPVIAQCLSPGSLRLSLSDYFLESSAAA